MTTSTQQLRRIEERARRVLVGIPGVSFRHALPRTSRQGSGLSGRRAHDRSEKGAEITLFGWTASLHGRILHQAILDVDDPDEEIDRLAAQQRRRHDEGRRLGATRPYHLIPPDNHGHPHPCTEVGHLQCDRAALEILLERHGGDPEPVTDLLCRIVHHKEGHDLGIAVIGLGSMNGLRISPRVKFSGAEIEGTLLTIHARLPETAVVHAVGQRLGSLASVHPSLDRRVIRECGMVHADESLTGEHAINIRLSTDTVRVRDVLCQSEEEPHGR